MLVPDKVLVDCVVVVDVVPLLDGISDVNKAERLPFG